MSESVRWAPRVGALVLFAIVPALPGSADEPGEAYETSLAMQLSNPVAALIGVPLQVNYDPDIGPLDDGDRHADLGRRRGPEHPLRAPGSDVDATFLQPFLTYTESIYDWESDPWSVPVNTNASKLLRFGAQLASWGGGVRSWLDSPDSGAEGFGLRMTVTLPFPR